MGALKTGGQGSVYKGRRMGEIITAIKLLPTPIYSESTDDKNFTSFHINQWNKAFNAINEKDGFIYVIYTNDEGQVSKGWLRKKILSP